MQVSENYLNYFAEWRKALLATGNFETYFNFLLPIFMLDSDNLTLKLFACNDLLRLLTLTGQNPCNTATYGLYLLRRKGQTERGLSYYDKAISMAQKDSAYTNMIEELRLKKDIESARCLIESDELNSGRRLLDKSYKHASKTLQGYHQSIERLLEEC